MIASRASVVRSRANRGRRVVRRDGEWVFEGRGGGKTGLEELRDQRRIARELREEEAAEASRDQPPFGGAERTWAWMQQEDERAVKRLNNVYKLRKERLGHALIALGS